MEGVYRGTLDICMASDEKSPIYRTQCKSLGGNIHPERPFQWLKKPIEFQVKEGQVSITRYFGYTGEGGSSRQLSLAVFHPVFGFCAPGKAFKDYQSPIVLDLNQNGKIDLVNVWDDSTPIRFDLNGNGEKVRTGWVKSGDGLLFWDKGTGCVENGTQLFGEYTDSNNGRASYANGFEALRAVVGYRDSTAIIPAEFQQLKVWRDINQNGQCEIYETDLASKYAKEISLSFRSVPDPPLTEDNEIRLLGEYIGIDGKKHVLADVWFKQRTHEKLLSQYELRGKK